MKIKSITHSMKFLTALVIFIILSSILSGCNDQRTDQENTSGQISKEIDLKSLHQEDTVLIKTWSSGTYRDEYEYNDQGWPVKMLTYKIDDEGVEKLFQKYEVEYDGSGQQILMKYWDEDQNLAAWFECEYDSLGYFKIEKYKNANGSINQRYEYEYEYDEQGNVKTENCFRFKGNKKKGYMCHHFTYDPGNEIRLAEYYDKKGKVSKRIEYNQGEITKETEYDDQGNVVNCRELEFDSQGREVKKTETDKEKCKYEQSEYDDAGNVIKKTYYLNDELSKTEEWEYDNSNNLLKHESIDEATDESKVRKKVQKHIELYEYDSAGNKTKHFHQYITELFNDSELVKTNEENSREEYEYNDQGNVIRETYYVADEKVKKVIEYEYNMQGELLKTDKFEYDSDGEICASRSTTYDGKGHFTGWETYIYHENGEAEKEEFHKQELIEKTVMVNDNINQNWLDGHLFILRQVLLKDSCISQYENQVQYY